MAANTRVDASLSARWTFVRRIHVLDEEQCMHLVTAHSKSSYKEQSIIYGCAEILEAHQAVRLHEKMNDGLFHHVIRYLKNYW